MLYLTRKKPDLQLDSEGVCSACRYYETRNEIDWNKRRQEFHNIIDRYRWKDGNNYDCIVPASGGKDSTRQVLTLLHEGADAVAGASILHYIGQTHREAKRYLHANGIPTRK